MRRRYDAVAGRYDRLIGVAERLLFGDGRRWVCAQARGEVLEIAVGTGRKLPCYPPGVRLTGIELGPAMLAIARRRAADLREGDAQALDFPDGRFDTVACTLGLCTIPDDRQAVAEAARVLRPGGVSAAPRTCPQPGPARARRPAVPPSAGCPPRGRPAAARAAGARRGGGPGGRAARAQHVGERRAAGRVKSGLRSRRQR